MCGDRGKDLPKGSNSGFSCPVGSLAAGRIIRERTQFIDATRTKLVLEIAGRQPETRVVPASAQAPRISCTIGEKLWQERWGGYDFR